MWMPSISTKHKQPNNNDPARIELAIANDVLVAIHKLEKETKVVSMNTKLHSIVREHLFTKLMDQAPLHLSKYMLIKMILNYLIN